MTTTDEMTLICELDPDASVRRSAAPGCWYVSTSTSSTDGVIESSGFALHRDTIDGAVAASLAAMQGLPADRVLSTGLGAERRFWRWDDTGWAQVHQQPDRTWSDVAAPVPAGA